MDPKKVFLIELHEIIKKRSEIRMSLINPSKDSNVWGEFKLCEEEINALKNSQLNDITLTAIEKTVRDSILGAFFDAFAVMDAVSDPHVVKVEDVWFGLRLVAGNEDDEDEDFLHDEVYSAYWDWLKEKNKQ